jgi:hypothetical protein
MRRTYSLAEVAEQVCGDAVENPERWLKEQIWAKRIHAIKIGRKWRMTDSQIEQAIEVFTSGPTPRVSETPVLGLTPASLRRRAS